MGRCVGAVAQAGQIGDEGGRAHAAGDVLGPARLWCDGRNESEGHELTNKLGVKCPKRMTAVRWLWTIRNQPQKVRDVAHITTPSGFTIFKKYSTIFMFKDFSS